MDIKSDLIEILKNYSDWEITDSGKRSINKQITYVIKRPLQYPKTVDKFFEDYNLPSRYRQNRKYISRLLKDKEKQENWLTKTIKYFSKLPGKQGGFRHISGFAVDVWVKRLSLDKKVTLANQIKSKGYEIIFEQKLLNGKIKYYVSINVADIFHVQKNIKITKNVYQKSLNYFPKLEKNLLEFEPKKQSQTKLSFYQILKNEHILYKKSIKY